jgi:tRNA(fMet)-specific endonuclease VapC
MGLILDTSIIVALERRGKPASANFAEIGKMAGDVPVALSAMTIFELMHGVERARTPEQAQRQLAFVDLLCHGIPVFPVSLEIARIAGRIEGALAGKGIAVALDDLLIGATALHLGFGVATLNTKHFAQIPNLVVTVF